MNFFIERKDIKKKIKFKKITAEPMEIIQRIIVEKVAKVILFVA